MADQWQQWADQLAKTSGADSGNIYQNYARLGNTKGDPSQFAGNVAQAEGKIDEVKTANAKAVADAANDPGKAQMRLLPNNQGYAFYDGSGKQISINDYSLLTGKRPDELLGDSPNPKDQKFVQDYKTLMAFTNAWVNGDKDTLSKLKAADPDTFNNLTSNYKSPSDVINAFTQHWSDYYSPGQGGQQNPNTPSFGPNPTLNAPGSKSVGVLENGSNLSDIMNPNVQAPPRALNFAEKLNPFSGQRDEIKRYQDYLQKNPWAAYQLALKGNNYGTSAWNSLLGK